VTHKNGVKWATDSVKTAGAPASLEAVPDRPVIQADGRDLSFVTVRVLDGKGFMAPRADNRIKFTIEGPGEIVATDNGDPTSFEPFQARERKAFNGLCLVIVRAKAGQTGRITLTASSEGLKDGATFITAAASNP
jgi:beta-galactosidase